MEFGVFLPIGNNGWILSETSPQYLPTFELNRRIVEMADEYGMDFALSMVKFRGYGGKTRHWDYCLESLTLMAGLASVSQRVRMYASVSPITLHPAITARMAVTIDDISNGRFGINIVAGWNRSEYEQMGLWPGDEFYEYRYDYASEYVTIMRELWATGRSSFAGRFFTLDDCMCLPMPEHEIKIVGAGSSPRGCRFVAEHADFQFGPGVSPESVAASNRVLLAEAAKTGRNVGLYANASLVIDDTDEAAQRRVELYERGADDEAIAFMTGQYTRDPAQDGSSAQVRARSSAFYGLPTAGSPATIARYIDSIAAVEGVAGIMLVFDDFLVGMKRFGEEVMPLLECRRDALATY